MKTAVIVFPASNCDRDAQVALREVTGQEPQMIWHAETELPEGLDLVLLPGGFAHGDYLRCGAIAARSKIMEAVKKRAEAGGPTLGICNGFQILCETGILPGALMSNTNQHFISREVTLRVGNSDNPFTRGYSEGDFTRFSVAHHDGNYQASDEELDRLEGEGRVAFRYVEPINGAARQIAGIVSEDRKTLGMMPHPERAMSEGAYGRIFFERMIEALAA
ncbi:phosphoribosylformylglycinamidine synthase subunit PurQ [Parvularcula sp. ZS-1/3]|uniref:Phosphoribosylformylglycinamidine synthase subunit PurQ n=1 Tax=Parvularcula mediterranea TaxID=2732508 RepID=A0A7Y3RK74_9PROT|nr:phosphoribosylformylglycinamidine synthase subunit PurQ [Parvularcula mediterranea]NNU15505.1 phosphoribosylformylglycinamidine synthase subunit PurQ [Parvularcula mediterranea]